MSEPQVSVSSMQRLWLKEMGVGRWLLPEPPRRPAPSADAGVQVATAAAAPSGPAEARRPADDASGQVRRSGAGDALALLAAGRDRQAGRPAAARLVRLRQCPWRRRHKPDSPWPRRRRKEWISRAVSLS